MVRNGIFINVQNKYGLDQLSGVVTYAGDKHEKSGHQYNGE